MYAISKMPLMRRYYLHNWKRNGLKGDQVPCTLGKSSKIVLNGDIPTVSKSFYLDVTCFS